MGKGVKIANSLGQLNPIRADSGGLMEALASQGFECVFDRFSGFFEDQSQIIIPVNRNASYRSLRDAIQLKYSDGGRLELAGRDPEVTVTSNVFRYTQVPALFRNNLQTGNLAGIARLGVAGNWSDPLSLFIEIHNLAGNKGQRIQSDVLTYVQQEAYASGKFYGCPFTCENVELDCEQSAVNNFSEYCLSDGVGKIRYTLMTLRGKQAEELMARSSIIEQGKLNEG